MPQHLLTKFQFNNNNNNNNNNNDNSYQTDQKAIKKTRDKEYLAQNHPVSNILFFCLFGLSHAFCSPL
jgi:hypothetical protein